MFCEWSDWILDASHVPLLNFVFEKCWVRKPIVEVLIFSEQGERSRSLPKFRILVVFAKTIPKFCIQKIFIGNVGTGGILCWMDSLTKF